MTREDDLERTLRSLFHTDATGRAPGRVSIGVLEGTRRRRQHPAWLAALLGEGMPATRRLGGRSIRLLASVALIAGLVMAVVGAAILSDGATTPAPLPIKAPVDFVLPPPICSTATVVASTTGPLPSPGARSPVRHRNGLLAFGGDGPAGSVLSLLDPDSGRAVATWTGVWTAAGGWSPDGAWLVAYAWSSPPGDPGCGDLYLVSADGSRYRPLTDNAIGDETRPGSWSPDGRWLAIATNHSGEAGYDGSVIDTIAIGDDGSPGERRRVFVDTVHPVIDLAWGPDGTLAWVVQGDTGDTLDVLGPGATHFVELTHGESNLFPIRWSADAARIVAMGVAGSVGHLFSIDAVSGVAATLEGAVQTRTDKMVFDSTVAVSTAGRVFFPGHDSGPTEIYSVSPDGTGLRDVSASVVVPTRLATGPLLSPDETQLAFGEGYGQRSTWLARVDGTDAHELTGSWGLVSWQPLP